MQTIPIVGIETVFFLHPLFSSLFYSLFTGWGIDMEKTTQDLWSKNKQRTSRSFYLKNFKMFIENYLLNENHPIEVIDLYIYKNQIIIVFRLLCYILQIKLSFFISEIMNFSFLLSHLHRSKLSQRQKSASKVLENIILQHYFFYSFVVIPCTRKTISSKLRLIFFRIPPFATNDNEKLMKRKFSFFF